MRFIPQWFWPWFASLMLPVQAYAVPENIFEQEFQSRIMPAFWSTGESAFLTTADGLKIHYRKYVKPGQEKALVILPGRTESTFKFAEVLHDLQDLNLAVFIIDHRGQGASSLEVKTPQLQYVRSFSFYKDDLTQLVHEAIQRLGFKEVYALGHSMGANIISLFMVQHPKVFQKVVLSSPMLDLSPAPFPFQWMAYSFVTIACWFGFDKTFVPGHGPFNVNDTYRGTGSAVRFKAFNELRAQKTAEIMGGVSYRFTQQALVATWDMRRDAKKLLAPILMFQSGKDDVVLTGGQDYVCQHAKQCQKVVFPDARHEIHIETDAIRDPWLQNLRQFLGTP